MRNTRMRPVAVSAMKTSPLGARAEFDRSSGVRGLDGRTCWSRLCCSGDGPLVMTRLDRLGRARKDLSGIAHAIAMAIPIARFGRGCEHRDQCGAVFYGRLAVCGVR